MEPHSSCKVPRDARRGTPSIPQPASPATRKGASKGRSPIDLGLDTECMAALRLSAPFPRSIVPEVAARGTARRQRG